MDENRGGPSKRLSLTRKQLYDMVWSTPMLRLSRTFRCSATWLARICREASVPVPPRGYWAKKRAGKAARRKALHRSVDPDEVVVSYTPRDKGEEAESHTPPPPPPPPLDEDLEALRVQIEQAGSIQLPVEFDQLHPVVARTRRALQQADALGREHHGLLEPRSVHEGCLLDLEISAAAIDRAVRLFEGLFRAVQQFGGRVVSKDKDLRITLLGDEVRYHLRERPRMRRLTPEEMKDRWAGKIRWEGSGVLDLSISTDAELGCGCRWSDGRKGPIENRLQQVLLDTVEAIQAGRRWRCGAPAREAERRRQQEEDRQREAERLRQEEERRLERERVEYLLELAAQHARATQLRTFLTACRDLPDRSSTDDRWIAWGEQVLAGMDPLANGLAPILAARPAYGPALFAAFSEAAVATADSR